MSHCVHGCRQFRRHDNTCPVEDRQSGAWLPWTIDQDTAALLSLTPTEYRARALDDMCNADVRATAATNAGAVHIGRYGGLEVWHTCGGCLPREAEHGPFCSSCHHRLVGWLAGDTHKRKLTPSRPAWSRPWPLATRARPRPPADPTDTLFWPLTGVVIQPWTPTGGALAWRTGTTTLRRWTGAAGSVAWAHDWIAADTEPSQSTAGQGKIRQGKKEPPAALALHVHDLRQDLCRKLGQWLRQVTGELDLVGPTWWAHRADTRSPGPESWRAWLPQGQWEIDDAQRYLAGWVDRIETVPGLAELIYREANDLMARVSALAPWRARARKLPGLTCPECDRDALAIYDGEVNLTCQRCKAVIPRQKYDRWSYVIESEKE